MVVWCAWMTKCVSKMGWWQTISSARGSRFDTIRAFLPECNARYPSEGIKGTVPSFLPFPSITQSRNDVDLCMKLEELSKNTSASARDHTSSDNIRSCNPGVFDSGATYRIQSQRSSQHSTRDGKQQHIRYACTYLSPLRRSISILSRLTTTFRQPRATTYRPYMYDM